MRLPRLIFLLICFCWVFLWSTHGYTQGPPARDQYSAQPQLAARQAARADALRNLTDIVYGVQIDSRTRMRDLGAGSGALKAKLDTAINNAGEIDYFEGPDGTAELTLELPVSEIENILGRKINYDGQVFTAVGYGAQSGGDPYREATQTAAPMAAPSAVPQTAQLPVPLAVQAPDPPTLHVLAEKPKVMVIIDEKVGGLFGTTGSEPVGQAEATMNERLLSAGFNVVDPDAVRANITRDKALRILEGDNTAAATEGLKYGAQIVITGKALSKNAGGKLYGTNMQSIQATLQVRVIRTDTGKVLGSKSAQASQAHIDELQGGALAIKEASEKLSDEIIELITKQWSGEVYGRSQEITIMISGLVSYRHLTAVKQILEKETQGVKAVHQRNFTGGIAELAIDYGGKAANIADELANRRFTGFRLEPTNVTPGRIDIKAIIER